MTRSKSTCGGCCCNGCEVHLPEDVRCCCHCVCDALCVTLSIPFDTDCLCTPTSPITTVTQRFNYDCLTNSWHGVVDCGSLSIDLDFSVKRCEDPNDNVAKCYVCMKSTCLSKTGACPTDCDEIGSAGRDFCRGMYINDIERTGGFEATFENIDFSDCDIGGPSGIDCLGVPGGGTISITCIDRLFPSCFKNCDSVVCDGCTCIPLCVCVDYSDDDCAKNPDCDDELSRRTCWDDVTKSWSIIIDCGNGGSGVGDVDFQFTLQKNEDSGLCEIFVTSTALGISESTPQPGESVEANPQLINCDNFNPAWSYDFSGRNISVHLIDKPCGDCHPAFGCCLNLPAPRTDPFPPILDVEIEITGAHECTCAGSAEITFQIHFIEVVRRGDPAPDPDFSCAIKYVGNTIWCNEPAVMTVWICDTCLTVNGITIEFETCSGGSVHCSTQGTGCDCASGMTCQPIFFTTSDNLATAGCCAPDDATQMDITITEP